LRGGPQEVSPGVYLEPFTILASVDDGFNNIPSFSARDLSRSVETLAALLDDELKSVTFYRTNIEPGLVKNVSKF